MPPTEHIAHALILDHVDLSITVVAEVIAASLMAFASSVSLHDKAATERAPRPHLIRRALLEDVAFEHEELLPPPRAPKPHFISFESWVHDKVATRRRCALDHDGVPP
jgi:hypothetical protein